MGQTVVDLTELLAATAVFVVLLGLSGSALGAFADRLGAKELAPSWHAALLLSLAVLPAALSLIARLVSLDAALAAQVVLALLGLPAARKIGPPPLAAVCGLLACAVVVGLELTDFRWGGKLYHATFAIDMVKHAATVNAIVSWGLPLTDPFVSRAEPAGYYYFFYTVAASPVRLTQGTLDARAAVGALAVLNGAALLALAALLQRKSVPGLPAAGRLSVLIALLMCGNLDIIPNIMIGLATHFWPIEIEWWTDEQILPWLFSVLWVPHHVLALIAGLFGLLFVCERPGAVGAVVAAIAFASCVGASVWVGLGVALAALLWLASLMIRGHRRAALALAGAGCLAGLLLVPLVVDILQGRSGQGFPIGFTVRPFPALPVESGFAYNLISLLLLPLTYFIGFGISAVGAVMFWRDPALGKKTEVTRILLFAAVAGLLLGTFTRSTVVNNDLGWRVLLLPQLAMLVWTSAVILARYGTFRIADVRKWPAAVGALLMIGYAGIAYELVAVRAYPLLVPNLLLVGWGNPDIDDEIASAYGWANIHVSRDAVLQHNPVGDRRVLAFGLYGRNRTGVADKVATIYGAPWTEVDARIAALAPIFTAAQPAAEVRARAIANGIDVLVVSSTDPVWSDRDGWVWSSPVLFALPHVRLIATRDLAPEPKT